MILYLVGCYVTIENISPDEWQSLVGEGVLISLKNLLMLAGGLDPKGPIDADSAVDLGIAKTFGAAWDCALDLQMKGDLGRIYTTPPLRSPHFDPIFAFYGLKNSGFNLCDKVESLLKGVDRFEIPLPLNQKKERCRAKPQKRNSREKSWFEIEAEKIWKKDPSLTITAVTAQLYSHVDARKFREGKPFEKRTIREWIRGYCPNPQPGSPKVRKKRPV